MEIKLIKTKKEYNAALQRVDELFAEGAKKDSIKGNELELLLVLIDKYEETYANRYTDTRSFRNN